MMTKKIMCFIIISAIILICCTGCNSKKGTLAETHFTDKTVAVDDTFDPENFDNIIELKSSPDFSKIYSNVEELYPDSENIVCGTVKEISYFDNSGVGNTIYTFAVENVYKGNLEENDLISVLTAGGYARLSKHIEVFGKGKFSSYTAEQINNTVLKTDFMGSSELKVGDEYMIFLSAPINNEPPFPDGVYTEIGAFMGRYVRTNNKFSRYVPEDEPNFYGVEENQVSLKEFEAELNAAKSLQMK